MVIRKELGYSLEFEYSGQESAVLMQPQLFNDFISPWARNLPSGFGVLDIAGGQGIEAKSLQQSGTRVVSLDISRSAATTSVHDGNVVGCAEFLPFADNTFSGAFIKDALIFLSPEAKRRTLDELRRVLVPGGSVLIISQLGDMMRIHYPLDPVIPIPQWESYETDSDWENKLTQLNASYPKGMMNIEFICTPSSIEAVARESGFDFNLNRQYRFDDSLARESRWVKSYSGFVATLTSK